MQAIFLTILITVFAAYTVAWGVDIFANWKTYRKLGDLIDMVLILYSKTEGLCKRIEDIEAAQAQAPRLVSLKPEGKVADVHTRKGGSK